MRAIPREKPTGNNPILSLALKSPPPDRPFTRILLTHIAQVFAESHEVPILRRSGLSRLDPNSNGHSFSSGKSTVYRHN